MFEVYFRLTESYRVLIVFSLLSFIGFCTLDGFSSQRPNVIVIITDDQGYGDLSCHGNPILETPNLDALHEKSVRFTNFHVSPTCAPTRGALMSGQDANRSGVWHTVMGRSLLFEGKPTLGELFSQAGYRTGLFGKWHLGDNFPFRPDDRGFDEVLRHGAGGVGQAPDFWDNAYFNDTYIHNGNHKKFDGYCTDVFFNEARRFMAESSKSERPFFAYISTNAPHSPFHVEERYWKPYIEKGLSEREAIFFGMIANIDENVGRLRHWLEARGLLENTLLIFLSDNGTASGRGVFNAGMRGQKGSEYEGGHRVPFFLHWPEAGFNRGRDIDLLTAHFDVLPTLADLCGLDLPQGHPFDGRSLAPLLFELPLSWPDRTIIIDSQRLQDPVKWRKSSVMTQQWRLINGVELYDIQDDPGQENDLAKQNSEVVKSLRANYEDWWSGLQPWLRRNARIVIGHPAENPMVLSSHDWYTDDRQVPWNQQQIRAASAGKGFFGKWMLQVHSEGTYRVALRRWPSETSLGLREGLPPGPPVPGMEAFRETPGRPLNIRKAHLRIGDKQWDKIAEEGAQAVIFDLNLSAGEISLEAGFTTDQGDLYGAYYVTVEKSH